ncbi:uncharacterized protein LOC132312004 [Cornus florida]|uniref:uncharacterized protein LOC132312004 n=1 Tax=Cornus florida TaxID=4283 RepID=UPI00289EC311|nr:uncharacterized protein LOC132312004 [Cornus florida]XP_059666192.1 uncharacterized protein LOC132312004 [Cornus florida]
MESKQHTPSVIAKLMGLDEFPPQQPIHKQQRVLSENYLRKTASIGLREKRSCHDGHPSKIKVERQEECRDCFEVPEIPNVDKHCTQSVKKGEGKLIITETKMPNKRYKITDAKCLSLQGLKDATWFPPTRIVVLKPNIGKPHNAVRSLFSPSPQKSFQLFDRKHIFSKPKYGGSYDEVRKRESWADDAEPSRHSFRVSREFAKEITRQISHSISSSSTVVSRSEFRVDDTSANEFDAVMPSCPSFFDWKNRCQTSRTSTNDSSLAREAKKQLSERWKMINRSQEIGVSSRGNTLGKMLAMPDQETKPINSNNKLDKHGLNNQFSLDGGDADLDSPIGISSRDGWKDVCARNLPRFRALPGARSTKSNTRKGVFHNDFSLKLEEAATREKNEPRKPNFSWKDSSKPRDSSFSHEKSQSSPNLDSEDDNTIQGTRLILDEIQNKIVKEDLSGENPVVSKLSICSVPCSDFGSHTVQGTQVVPEDKLKFFAESNLSENSMVPNLSINSVASANMAAEVLVIAESENVRLSSGTCEEQQSESRACILVVKDGHTSLHALDASDGQESSIESSKDALASSNCPKIDPEFHMSLGEGYSPSPNSVLEPPFQEEVSYGSECFESVSADLHGLRMQLQLLKSESDEANSEGHGMAVSSDEDNEEGSVDLSEENSKFVGMFIAEESRDFSYIIDVLDEAGFHSGNLEMNFEAWQSPECLLSSSVFEILEKKYGEQTSWKKSERRLLFDRLNMGLMEILRPCMDMYLCAKPFRKKFSLSRTREVVEEELWTLLVSEEKEVCKDLSEKVLGGESRCIRLGDHIEVIGIEIERFLFDELVAELASTESF